jgi:hypothetical protein
MKTTLRQLDKALQKIAEAHDLKPDYFWGDWADSVSYTHLRAHETLS